MRVIYFKIVLRLLAFLMVRYFHFWILVELVQTSRCRVLDISLLTPIPWNSIINSPFSSYFSIKDCLVISNKKILQWNTRMCPLLSKLDMCNYPNIGQKIGKIKSILRSESGVRSCSHLILFLSLLINRLDQCGKDWISVYCANKATLPFTISCCVFKSYFIFVQI